MWTVKLLLNKSCNLNCAYCFEKGTNYDNDNHTKLVDNLPKVIEFINKNGSNIQTLTIMGGETYLDIVSLSNLLNAINFNIITNRVVIHTNGTIFNEAIKRIYSQYSNNVFIVITDHKKNIGDDIIGKHVDYLTRNKLAFQVTSLITTDSLENPKKLLDYLIYMYNRSNKHLILHMEYYNPHNPITTSILQNFFHHYIGRDDIPLYLRYEIDNCIFKYDRISTLLKTDKYDPEMCGGCVNEITISRDGRIYACENILNSNVYWSIKKFPTFNKLLMDVDFSTIRKFNKVNPRKCDECKYILLCSKCKYNHYLSSGPLDSKSSVVCEFSRTLYDFTLSVFHLIIHKRLDLMESEYIEVVNQINDILSLPHINFEDSSSKVATNVSLKKCLNEIDGNLVLIHQLGEILACDVKGVNK